MPKAAHKVREEARRLFLTGEMAMNAEIAAHVCVKPHTVGFWRKQEDWDGLRRKIDRRQRSAISHKRTYGSRTAAGKFLKIDARQIPCTAID